MPATRRGRRCPHPHAQRRHRDDACVSLIVLTRSSIEHCAHVAPCAEYRRFSPASYRGWRRTVAGLAWRPGTPWPSVARGVAAEGQLLLFSTLDLAGHTISRAAKLRDRDARGSPSRPDRAGGHPKSPGRSGVRGSLVLRSIKVTSFGPLNEVRPPRGGALPQTFFVTFATRTAQLSVTPARCRARTSEGRVRPRRGSSRALHRGESAVRRNKAGDT